MAAPAAPRAPSEPQVPVRAPDGALGTVPQSQADAAVHQGYQPVDVADYQREQLEQQYGGLGGVVKAGAEGLGRGLTFGLSDLAGRELGGEEYRKAAAARRELFPGTETAGEIAGVVAPTLLSGGSGLVGKALGTAGALPRGAAALGGLAERGVGSLVGRGAESLAARALQSGASLGARGLVEGALYGAGQGITEAALGDEDLTAEKLFASMGEHAKGGAIMGAVTGGALGVLGEVGKAAGQRALKLFDESSLSDYFKSFADERTIKALGASQRDIARMGKSAEGIEARMSDIAETVRGYRFEDGEKLFKAGDTIEDLAQKTSRAVEEQGKRLAEIREKLGAITAERPELGPDVGGLLQKVDDEVLAPLRESNVASIQDRAGKVERELAGLRARIAPPELPPELEQLRSASPEAFEKLKVSNPSLAEKLAPKPVTLEELTQTRRDLDKIIYPKAKGASGLPPLPPEHMAELQQVRALVEDEIEQASHRAAAASGDSSLAGELLDAKQKYSALKAAEQLTSKGVARDVGNRFFSPTDYAAGGVGAMLHGGPLGVATGIAGAAAHHIVRERGSSVLAVVADKLASISERTVAVDEQLSRGLDRFLGGAKNLAIKGATLEAPTLHPLPQAARNDFDSMRDRLVAAQANPEQVLDHVGHAIAPIADTAPRVSSGVVQTTQRAATYLQKQLPPPKPPRLGSPPPPPPDPVTKAAYMRSARGANDPMTVVHDLAKHKASSEQIQGMKAATPKLHAQLVEKTTQRLMDMAAEGKHLTYEQRLQASILTEQPLDETLEPDTIAMIQGLYQQQGGGGGAPSAPKRKLDMAGDFKSASEPAERA